MLMPLLGGEAPAVPRRKIRNSGVVSGRHAARVFHERQWRSSVRCRPHRRGRAADFSRSTRRSTHSHNPVWSPDGRWIYFVHGVDVDREDGYLADSAIRRGARATDRPACCGEFSGAARRANADLHRACGGRNGPGALDARCAEQGHAQGQFRSRALHFGGGQSRWQAHRGDRRQPEREPVARAAGRSARRRSRRAAVPRVRPCARWRRGSPERRSFILRPAALATACGI